jgi:N-acetylglucosamine-6-phosphate deacetylase
MKRKRPEAGKVIQFWNCRLLRNHKLIEDDLWIRDGIILDPYVVFFDENVSADVKIDCKGLIIAPGYIDVQINGKVRS